jgi:hypothetical protein
MESTYEKSSGMEKMFQKREWMKKPFRKKTFTLRSSRIFRSSYNPAGYFLNDSLIKPAGI